MKMILKYNSLLDKQKLDLSTRELDVFFTALFYIQNDREIKIPYNIFIKMLYGRIRSKKVFKDILKKIKDTLFYTEAYGIDGVSNLDIFEILELNKEDEVHIKLNEDFLFLFEDRFEKSTRKFSVDEMMGMDTKYEKTLYRILTGYNNEDSGWYRVTEHDLHNLLCFPEKNKRKRNNYLIKKSIDSLSEYFDIDYNIKTNVYGNRYYDFKLKS